MVFTWFSFICLVLFGIGSFLAYLGNGMFDSGYTVAGAIICPVAIILYFLEYQGIIRIRNK